MKTSTLALSAALAAATPALAMENMEDMEGVMTQAGDWHLMAHGWVNAVLDHQGGPRGDHDTFSNSMFMGMASRPLAAGSLELHAMLSLDPAMGKGGYPLLFQTGETADGVTTLVDRQHPHDFFMELSAAYSQPLGDSGSVSIYGGLPGEAALGPPSFMHRFSGMRIPEAPLTHHWLDSTHVTMGVVTLGATQGPFKLEASAFNGREPDQFRWNIETRPFDSWSARLTWNPTAALSIQASYGYLASPEELEPDLSVRRTTASAIYTTDIAGSKWGTTLAWGRNDKRDPEHSHKLDGWLLESALEISPRHTVFARAERVNNDELFQGDDPLAGQPMQVGKVSVGYIYDFTRTGPLRWGIGALASTFRVPAEAVPAYGAHPSAYMVFLQVRL
jgi:hypothetical protein